MKDESPKPKLRIQACPECGAEMGDMPGSRDAVCPNCLPAIALLRQFQAGGYKDPCCE